MGPMRVIPGKTVTALSQADKQVILELIREEHNRIRNTTGRGREDAVDHEEFPAPEVYVALAPHGGIPAVAINTFETGTGTGTGTGTTFGDDVPGSAVCQIYQLIKTDDANISGTLKMVSGEVRRVYNANRTKVQAGSWFIAVRDKFETWWATSIVIGGTSSSGACAEITVVSNVCVDFVGTGTSGDVDAIIVEYSTYDLTDCSLIERWCMRNPLACCLVCNGIYYPEIFYATFTLVDGPAGSCADGVELTCVYQGVVTSGAETGSHLWRAGPVPLGTCTIATNPGPTYPQAYVTLDLYLRPSGCTFVYNLKIGNNFPSETICHNNLAGVIFLSTNPVHLYTTLNDQIFCIPDIEQAVGDILRIDWTV